MSHQQHDVEVQAALAAELGAERVVSIQDWAHLAGISHRTARRMIVEGDGPPVLKLSERLRGIRVSDHNAWLAARVITNNREI
jgi:predicted DNA-binding transcriptional regulator AlpA